MLNLKSFSNKPKRVVTFTGERSGEYDEKAVILVQSIKNVIKVPKGKSRDVLGVVASENAIGLAPNFFNGDLTMAALEGMNPELGKAIREAGRVISGADAIAKLKSGEIQELMPEDDKKALIESLVGEEEYPLITLIYKKDQPVEITADEYAKLSEEEQAEYNLRAKENRATLDGMIGKEGTFSSAAAYFELGGSDKVYADKACTEETEVNTEVEQFTKQLVYSVSEAIDFGGGQMLHVAYLTETKCRPSKKGQEHSKKKEDEPKTDAAIDGEGAQVTGQAPVEEVSAPNNEKEQDEVSI